jgi:hypothetical protein
MQEKAIEVMKKPLAPSNTSRAFTNGINSHLNLSNSKTRGKLLFIRSNLLLLLLLYLYFQTFNPIAAFTGKG